MLSAYLATKADTPYNILVVNWGELSTANTKANGEFFYTTAVQNVVTVGKRVGEFIGWLKRNGFADPKKVHVIGFSLGSHVAGAAGDKVKTVLGEPLARITGNCCMQYIKITITEFRISNATITFS